MFRWYLVVAASLCCQFASALSVMALGDSITGNPGCWRALLHQKLKQNNLTSNLTFVGTLKNDGCSVPSEGKHEGHGGFLATNVAKEGSLKGWLSEAKPEAVMMHFGTNDAWSAKPSSEILAAYSTMLDQMRASRPTIKLLIAQIIPLEPRSQPCPECNARVQALNKAIPGWATTKSTAGSPVTVVDCYTGFDTKTDTYDGVHPNENGNKKLAESWYPAVAKLLVSGS